MYNNNIITDFVFELDFTALKNVSPFIEDARKPEQPVKNHRTLRNQIIDEW